MGKADPITELSTQILKLIRETEGRGDVLRALAELATQPNFSRLANIWAPALYERDAVFFESFLVRHLDWGQQQVIERLLARAEADGCDSLFQALYPKTTSEDAWNNEIRQLAASPAPDGEVLAALQRRTFRGIWFGLEEETALALYQRGASQFSPFIMERLRKRWWGRQSNFATLRRRAAERNDTPLVLALFRTFATSKEWNDEIRRLLAQSLPAAGFVAALRERHPAQTWELDLAALGDAIEQYGMEIWPYIEESLQWLNHQQGKVLLEAAHTRRDDVLYWRLFFRVGHAELWNNELRNLLQQPLDNAALLQALALRTPIENTWNRWRLHGDVARALYKRMPGETKPFLEQFLIGYDEQLFAMATARNDDELLDFLSYLALRELSSLVWRAYPPESEHRWRKPDPKAQQELVQRSAPVLARFERLHAASPARYVCHAANVLSFVAAFEVWDYWRDRRHHPVFAYLATQHHADWLASSEAIRELLESPNIFVQITGLEMLQGGGPAAAQRVVENLPYMRALLRGRARIKTKELVLQALSQAALHGPTYAAAVMPVLEEAMDVRGRRGVSEKAMVQFVRTRRAQRTGAEAAPWK